MIIKIEYGPNPEIGSTENTIVYAVDYEAANDIISKVEDGNWFNIEVIGEEKS